MSLFDKGRGFDPDALDRHITGNYGEDQLGEGEDALLDALPEELYDELDDELDDEDGWLDEALGDALADEGEDEDA